MSIQNLTPHDVTVIGEKWVTWPRSGLVARLETVPQTPCQSETGLYGVPVYTAPNFTGVVDLPEDNTIDIIVSMPVAQYLVANGLWKGAILSPDSGPGQAVRNDAGQIIGVKRLTLWNPQN